MDLLELRPHADSRMSSISFWGYYGTHHRARFYPPGEYSILYKEYNLTRFNHQKEPLFNGTPM